MATFNEQVLQVWDEWELAEPAAAHDPNAFVEWALSTGKLVPRPQDVRKVLRAQVTDALRQAMRVNKEGVPYRAKQCLKILTDGAQIPFWFDSDRGTMGMKRKVAHQQRKALVDHAYRIKCDVTHFNSSHPEEAPIQLHLDLTDDVAELEAMRGMEVADKEVA